MNSNIRNVANRLIVCVSKLATKAGMDDLLPVVDDELPEGIALTYSNECDNAMTDIVVFITDQTKMMRLGDYAIDTTSPFLTQAIAVAAKKVIDTVNYPKP